MKKPLTLLWLAAASCSLLIVTQPVLAQGTAFTYQGFLTDQGAPAQGIYDLRFRLYADAGSGTVVAGPVDAGDVGVTNGPFTLTLDFGAIGFVFNGGDRWLEIGVRSGTSTGAYTIVAPLQKITATPYAIRAANFSGPVAASQITGTLAASNIGLIDSSGLAPGAAAANLNSSGQSGVARSGIILSANAQSTDLLSAGYIKLGQAELGELWLARGLANAPDARSSHKAVWTGSEMIIWGGSTSSGDTSTGARYSPVTDNWTPITTLNAPSARREHAAVWTGTEMLVWGGAGTSTLPGGRYDPATDSWTAMTTLNAPFSGRDSFASVWTGTELIIWGGYSGGAIGLGGRYTPASDTWTSVATAGAPTARFDHTAVWTGSEMIIWGGTGSDSADSGGRYSPFSDSWASMPSGGGSRADHTAVWTGSDMIVWGGLNSGAYLNTGARYNRTANSWTATTITGAPSSRYLHTAVWTGSAMVVWGGKLFNGSIFVDLDTGGRYDSIANSWAPTPSFRAPGPRALHTAVWTGNDMLVFGGVASGSLLNSLHGYTPPRTMYLYQRP